MGTTTNRMAIGGLGAWNVVVNRYLPDPGYVPANLAVAAATYLLGRAGGATNRQLGLGATWAIRGFRWGSVGAGLTAAAVVVAGRHSRTRHLFDDARAAEGRTAYETLLRIPLGTVVLEEVAFRGVVPALLDGPGRRGASLRTAALFGLWHILPTLNTLDINEVADRKTRAKAVAGGVGVTAVAGMGLDLLRMASGSIVAPALVHWSANAVAYALAATRMK